MTPATATSSAATTSWQTLTDPVTGTKFALPGEPKLSKKTATGPQGQRYQLRAWLSSIDNTIGCGVSVETSREGSLVVLEPSKAPRVFAARYKSAGAADVTIGDAKPVMVGRYRGESFTLSFTDDTSMRNTYYLRVINTARSQVITEVFAPDSVGEIQLESINARLTKSLRIQ